MREAFTKGSRGAPVDAAVELRRQVEVWVNEGGSCDGGVGMLRVLVIEDEPIIGMLLERILVGMGLEVIGVEGTEEGAVKAAARAPPGLILVDKRLRAGSGHAAMERILRDGFIPHIWMSGDVDRRTVQAPGVAVLEKPFTEHALALAIAQVCKPTSPLAPAGEVERIGPDEGRPRR